MTVHKLINLLASLPPSFNEVEVCFSEKCDEGGHINKSIDRVTYGEYGNDVKPEPFVYLKTAIKR